jgi:signal transduction histidine kinase
MSEPGTTPGFLKKVPLFAGLSEPDLQAIHAASEAVRLKAGQLLFAEGETGEHAYVIEQGEVEIFKPTEGREVLIAVRGAGEVIGEMALLRSAPRIASVRARGECTLLAISKLDFERLLATSPTAARGLFSTVLERWRATEAMLRHNERMAQLGVLTAGVAHEMNNPAAAVKRGADQLSEVVAAYAAIARDTARLELTPAQRDALARAEARALGNRGVSQRLDPLEQSDRTSAIEEWLEARGVDNSWELAPGLVDDGYDATSLQQDMAAFEPSQLPTIVRNTFLAGRARSLIAEIGLGAARISEIVSALKSYSYLDQAPVQDVDIREGLDNTLVILGNKLKAGIAVRREYDPDLPRIEAYGSELNQVWTNLIDNAADAMKGSGNLVLRARREGQGVLVEVEDDGPGIPPEVRPKVFDAFFTTKPPGKGTGLGLNISQNIVVHRHRGSIDVTSEPGRTCFSVWLPRRVERRQAG